MFFCFCIENCVGLWYNCVTTHERGEQIMLNVRKEEKDIYNKWRIAMKLYINAIKNDDLDSITDELLYRDIISYPSYVAYDKLFDELMQCVAGNKQMQERMVQVWNHKMGTSYKVEDCYFGKLTSQTPDISKYKVVFGNVDFVCSEDIDLSNLEYVYGKLDLFASNVKAVPNLRYVSGNLTVQNSKVQDLSSLRIVLGSANFRNSGVEKLSRMEYVGFDLSITASKVKDLRRLKMVGRDLFAHHTNELLLYNLEQVGGDALFRNSKVKDLSSLVSVGGTADFVNSEVEDLRKLTNIGCDGDFYKSKVENLSSLFFVKRRLDLIGCNIKNLNKLMYACNVYLSEGQVVNMSNAKIDMVNLCTKDNKILKLTKDEYVQSCSNLVNSQVCV